MNYSISATNHYSLGRLRIFSNPLRPDGSTARVQDMLAEAWRMYVGRWVAYATQLTRDPDEAQEIVQDAVTRTIAADPTLENLTDANAYVRQAIRTTATSSWRRASKLTDLEDDILDAEADPLQQMLRASNHLTSRRLAKRLMSAVDRLPEESRRVIRMRFFHAPRMKLREIAMIEGKAVSTIHSRIQSGFRRIAAELRKEDDAS